jgi:hypothetical protein
MVEEIGAVAGWAAVVGLAVLWALHVSQARDVRRLREWAGRAPERSRPGVPAAPQQIGTGAPRRSYRRIGTRPVAAVVVGLLVLCGTYGVTRLTGADGSANSDDRSPTTQKRNGVSMEPGDVTVAVLNGTMVPGLAATLRDQIAAAGFRDGTIDDYSDKQLGESVVQYAPGQQAAANAVGRRFGISRLEPATADSRALAGEATVIVIAGADKAP